MKPLETLTRAIAAACVLVLSACSSSTPQPITVGLVPEGAIDPEVWGRVYPLQYESWLKTREPKPAGRSRYKRGWDRDEVIYDRLSQFPFSALLYNGWGFGVEYNEPRGHYHALRELLEIDPSRTKPGGVCLACKSPYHRGLVEERGVAYLTAKFSDALEMLPEKHRELGPACVDCHQSDTMALTTNRPHILRGLELLGKKDLSHQERRVMACAQCHVTYFVPRDREQRVAADVELPWSGGSWGNIPIEGIIADLLRDHRRIEWTQSVTGFHLPYIRHPEFELFSRNSIHWAAGVSCPDCHMPYRRSGSYKISDHDVTSPLKAELRSCAQCHTESATWLRGQVFAIQDKTASLLNRAGYATAEAAKLFELAHSHRGQGTQIDADLYGRAKELYLQAFLRLVFVTAENSFGFHNPTEAARILGDAVAFAYKSAGLLRQALARAEVDLPEAIALELLKYLDNRGERGLNFRRDQEIEDPFGLQRYFTSDQSKGY